MPAKKKITRKTSSRITPRIPTKKDKTRDIDNVALDISKSFESAMKKGFDKISGHIKKSLTDVSKQFGTSMGNSIEEGGKEGFKEIRTYLKAKRVYRDFDFTKEFSEQFKKNIVGKDLQKFDEKLKKIVKNFSPQIAKVFEHSGEIQYTSAEDVYDIMKQIYTAEKVAINPKALLAESEQIFDEYNKIWKELTETNKEFAKTSKQAEEYSKAAEDAFDKFISHSAFGKIKGLFGGSKIGQFLGIDKHLEDQLSKSKAKFMDAAGKGSVTDALKGVNKYGMLINATFESISGTITGIGRGILAFLSNPLGWVALAAIAILMTLKKTFDLFVRNRETVFDLQKSFGLINKDARQLNETIQKTYYANVDLVASWDEARDTVSELFKVFTRGVGITDDLTRRSMIYQKMWGMTAEEAAKVLDIQMNTFGMTMKDVKAQDEYIAKLIQGYDTLDLSGKELKAIALDTEKVSTYGFDNLVKAYVSAKKLRLQMEDVNKILDVMPLGDFEESFMRAGKLAALGVKIDPLRAQLMEDAGQVDELMETYSKTFTNAGKDLTKVRGYERKMIENAVGGAENLLTLQRMQTQAKLGALSISQKQAALDAMSTDQLLDQSQAYNKIKNIGSIIEKIWESLALVIEPIFENIFEGFEEAFKPTLKLLASVNNEKDGILGDTKQWKDFGRQLGGFMSNLLTLKPPDVVKTFQDIAQITQFMGDILYTFFVKPIQDAYDKIKLLLAPFYIMYKMAMNIKGAFSDTADVFAGKMSVTDASRNNYNRMIQNNDDVIDYISGAAGGLAGRQLDHMNKGWGRISGTFEGSNRMNDYNTAVAKKQTEKNTNIIGSAMSDDGILAMKALTEVLRGGILIKSDSKAIQGEFVRSSVLGTK